MTLKTSGVVSAQVEAANLFTKGLTLTLDCETPAPGKQGLLSSGKGTIDYKMDALTCIASYDYYKGEAHGETLARLACCMPASACLLPTPAALVHAPHSCRQFRDQGSHLWCVG